MRIGMTMAACVISCAVASAQVRGTDPIEIPLRVEDGRLVVSVEAPDGKEFTFVLGLGMAMLTESGAARIGDSVSSLTLGGVPVDTEAISTVPDAELALGGRVPDGIVGGLTLNRFDVLIDVPGKRLVLKPVGRSVRWEGITLSSPVTLAIYHDVLARTDVEVNGQLYGGLLDLASPELVVNDPVRASSELSGDSAESFRMGYTGYSDLPFRVRDLPLFQGWDPEGKGFVVIGAAVTYDCAIAISWVHQEMRTCVR